MEIDYLRILYYVFLGGWIFIPTAVANMAPPIFKGKHPIDGGRELKDGRRLLGDGKTWEGLIVAPIAGMLVGVAQISIAYYFNWPFWELFGSFPDYIIVLFALSFGAVFGDALGSFIKRRIGIKRGQKAHGLDQYDLVGGVFILLLIAHWWTDGFFINNFINNGTYYPLFSLASVLIFTPIIHKGVNVIAWKIGKKDDPW